jgi:hypothetical protein
MCIVSDLCILLYYVYSDSVLAYTNIPLNGLSLSSSKWYRLTITRNTLQESADAIINMASTAAGLLYYMLFYHILLGRNLVTKLLFILRYCS